MKAPVRPRKKHEPVDGRLLATAGRCFIKEGFGYGIDDILAQAEVAKMSLYTNFQSKYGLIERLLKDSHLQWTTEIERLSADSSVRGTEKILRFVKFLCVTVRDPKKLTGLLGQALLEFPLTGETDDTHRKKDLVHQTARDLQLRLVESIGKLCKEEGIADPLLAARQIMMLANSYLIMKPLLNEEEAMQLALATAKTLFGASVCSTATTIASQAEPSLQVQLPKAKKPLIRRVTVFQETYDDTDG